MRPKLSLAGLVLVLFVFNALILAKERSLATGQIVYLELVPADPRSLMQGDYMRLRYRLTEELGYTEGKSTAYLTVGPNKVATNLSFESVPGSLPVNIVVHEGRVLLGAESYFFEEGTSQLYARAKYGVLAVDSSGSIVLTGLLDEDMSPLKQ